MVGSDRTRLPDSTLTSALTLAVAGEFILLRTGTRALIHIPGLGRLEDPIRALAEVGRFAYYLAVVLVLACLVAIGVTALRSTAPTGRAVGIVVVTYLSIWLTGRLGIVSPGVVGWVSLGVLVAAVALTWRGYRSVPIALFVLSSLAAGSSVLAQGDGGGLSGSTVDTLVVTAEVFLLLAGLTSPLLAGGERSRPALIAGAVATVVSAGAFTAAGSTVSIIVLWNVGVPGWLPGIFYALAIGSLTFSAWVAVAKGKAPLAIGVVLLVAGGVGVMSTYQTALSLLGVLWLGEGLRLVSEDQTPDVGRTVPVESLPEFETVGTANVSTGGGQEETQRRTRSVAGGSGPGRTRPGTRVSG